MNPAELPSLVHDLNLDHQTIDQILTKTWHLRAAGNHDSARRLLHAALETENIERRVNFYSDLGTTEAHAGMFNAAMQAHRLCLALAPDFTPSSYQLACLLAATGKFDEANALFSQNLPVPTDNGERTSTAIVRF